MSQFLMEFDGIWANFIATPPKKHRLGIPAKWGVIVREPSKEYPEFRFGKYSNLPRIMGW